MDDFDEEKARAEHEAWQRLHDKYRAAMKPVLVLGQETHFYFQIAPGSIVADLGGWEVEGLADLYVDYVATQYGPIARSQGLEVAIEPYGGPKTGGPIPDQQYVIAVFDFASQAISTIVDFAAFGVLVARFLEKTRELTHQDTIISDGVAIILASEAIHKATGEADLTLAFVQEVRRWLPDVEEMESGFDGWMVAFRSLEKLFIAHVDYYGGVTIPAAGIDANWASPGWRVQERYKRNKRKKGT